MDRPRKATAEDIAAFEAIYDVRLPLDMRTYYETVGGTEFGDGDQAYMTFWPLSNVGPVSLMLAPFGGSPDYRGIEHTLPDADKHFAFLDHSLNVCVYAIRLSRDPFAACPVVKIQDGKSWSKIAESFGEVLRIYEQDAWKLL